jgi:serine phosphatase RsbU (regulator of sigma subunit)
MFQLAKELAGRDPDEMLKQLMNAAIAQSGGAPHDDITAIVLKRT